MLDIGPFDVFIASVRFEDKPEVAKPRPVIIVSVMPDEYLVVAIKVTSHAPREWCPGEVVLVDWEAEGLAKPSVARCSKIVMLSAGDLKCRIGTLSARDRAAVSRAVQEL